MALLLWSPIIQSQSIKYETLPYEFSYDIRSSDSDNYYGHHQSQDELGITTGSYYLLSPDGVWRETTFSDKGSGFQAVTKRNPLNSPPSNVLEEDGLAVYFSLGNDDTEGQRSLIGVPVISNSYISTDQGNSGFQIPTHNKRMVPKTSHNLLKEEENIGTAEVSNSKVSLLPEENDQPQTLEEEDAIPLEDETPTLPDETKSATLTNEEESHVPDPANDPEISLPEKRSPLFEEEDLKLPHPLSSSDYPISFSRSPLDIKVPEVPLDILSLAYTSPEVSGDSEEPSANTISLEPSPEPSPEPEVLPDESETSEQPIQASESNQNFASSSNTNTLPYSTTSTLTETTDVLVSEPIHEKNASKYSFSVESSDALHHIQNLDSTDSPKAKTLNIPLDSTSQDISTFSESAPTYSTSNSPYYENDSSHPLSPPSPTSTTSTPSTLEQQPLRINLSQLADKIGNSGISKIIKHLENQEKNRIGNIDSPKREIQYEFDTTRQPALIPAKEKPDVSSIAINEKPNEQNKSYPKNDSAVEKATAYVNQENSKIQNTGPVLMEEITPISKERSPSTAQQESELSSSQGGKNQILPLLEPVYTLRNYKPGSKGLLQTLNKNKLAQLPFHQQRPNVRDQAPKHQKISNNNPSYSLPNIDLSKFTKPGEVVNKVNVINLNSPFPLANPQALSSTRINRESIPEAISKLLSQSPQNSQRVRQPKPNPNILSHSNPNVNLLPNPNLRLKTIPQSNKTLPISALPNSNLRILPYPNPKIQILSNNNDDNQVLSLLKQNGFLTNQNIKIIRGPQSSSELKRIQQIINNQKNTPQQIQIPQLLSHGNKNLRSVIPTQPNLPYQRQPNKHSIPQTPKTQISSNPDPIRTQVSSSKSKKKSSGGKLTRIVLPPNHKLVDVLRRLAKERPYLVSTKPFPDADNITEERLPREIAVATEGTSKQNNTSQNSISQYDPPKQTVKIHGDQKGLNYGIHPLETSRPVAFIPVSRKENNPYRITLPEQNLQNNTNHTDSSLVKMKKLLQGVSSLGVRSNIPTITVDPQRHAAELEFKTTRTSRIPIKQVKESSPQHSEIVRPIKVQITKGQLDGAQALRPLPYSQLHKLLRPKPRVTTPTPLLKMPPHSVVESSQIGTNYNTFQQFRERIENEFKKANLNSPPKRAQPSRNFYTPQAWVMGDKNSWIPSQQQRRYNSNPDIYQNGRGNHERFVLPTPKDSSDPMQRGGEEFSQQEDLADLEGSYSSPSSSYINTRLFLALPPENLF